MRTRSDLLILCGGAPSDGADHPLALNLRHPNRTFRLEIEDISRALAATVPDRLVDLLEIASYVFAADGEVSRGGDVRRDWGDDWRRRLRLRIPVRDQAFWLRADVGAALTAALRFLSEDVWSFEFVASTAPAALQEYLPLDPRDATRFQADEVALFSGGVDSLAGLWRS